MSMDVAATWTGYGLWAVAILAAAAVLVVAIRMAAEGAYSYLRDVWALRHRGHLGAVHEILQDPHRSPIEQVHDAFQVTRNGLSGQSTTADEVEHGRPCPACGKSVRIQTAQEAFLQAMRERDEHAAEASRLKAIICELSDNPDAPEIAALHAAGFRKQTA